MSKILVFLGLLLVSSFCLTNKEILQQAINGGFEQNKLQDPTTIMPCIDEETSTMIVKFIGQTFDKASLGSAAEVISLYDDIKNLQKEVSQPVKDCLAENKQIEAFLLKYNISATQAKPKFSTYVQANYIKFHTRLQAFASFWKSGLYFQTMYNLAVYAHEIFNISSSQIDKVSNTPNKDNLQIVLNGLFSSNKLPNPITILPCIDEEMAERIMIFTGVSLDQASKTTPYVFNNLTDQIYVFGNSILQQTNGCLDENLEIKAFRAKYGIEDSTEASFILDKIKNFVTDYRNFPVAKGFFGTLLKEWENLKYFQTASRIAMYGQKIFGVAPKLRKHSAEA